MAALPYMQFYVADYLADTMHLTTEEHGAYLLLLMNYWQTGKPIPKNRLQVITRLSNDRWILVEVSLQEFFNDNGIYWAHSRVEADLKIVRDSQKQRIKAGKASAESRKKAKLENEKSNGKAGTARGVNDRSNEKPTTVDDPLEREPSENPTNKIQNRTEQNRTEKKEKQRENRKRFVPPTVDEVKKHCEERKNNIDPQEFIDHYEANGWMRGQNKIKDWKACVRTWESSRKTPGDGGDWRNTMARA